MKLQKITRKDGTQYYRVSGDNAEVPALVAFAKQQLGFKNFFYRVTQDTNYIVNETRKRAVIQVWERD